MNKEKGNSSKNFVSDLTIEQANQILQLIVKLREKRPPCLRALIKDLRKRVGAEAAGFLWLERKPSGAPTIIPCLRLSADTSQGQAPALTENKKELKLVTAQLEKMASKLNAEDHFASGKGSFLQRLDIVQLPPFSEQHITTRTGFVWFQDRPTNGSQNYIQALSAVLKAWVWRTEHERRQLLWACEYLEGIDPDKTPESKPDELLESQLAPAIKNLRRVLDVPDLCSIFNACELVRWKHSQRPSRVPDRVYGPLNENLKEWHGCPLMRGEAICFWQVPKERAKELRERQDLGDSLKYWSFWRHCPSDWLRAIVSRRLYSNPKSSRVGIRALERKLEKLEKENDFLIKNAKQTVELLTSPGEPQLGNRTQDELQSFFLSKALPVVAKKFKGWPCKTTSAASSEEMAAGVKAMAEAAYLLLGEAPLGDEAIQSLIWIVSEYAHSGLKVPDRLDLRAHLLQAARHEPALHVLKAYYRDHFFHALEVCFLGHFLLELKMADKQPLWVVIAEKLGLTPAKEEFTDQIQDQVLRLWYLAALLHDVGYLTDILQGVHKQLKFFEKTEPLKHLSARLEASMRSLSGELVKEPFLKCQGVQEPGRDHGVVGAVHLRSLLESIARDDARVKPQEYDPAVQAIRLHNSSKLPVAFKTDPLAFLLILCDTIQEWNRPKLSFATAPAEILALLLDPTAGDGWQGGPLESLRITRPKKDILHFKLRFDESIGRSSNVFRLWLDASRNLQRLDFDAFPLSDIEVEFVTPPFRRGVNEPAEPQMDRLRDAAGETHMTFLDAWLPSQSEQTAITYELLKDSGRSLKMEHLTLHLRKLSKDKPVTMDMSEFYARLPKWRRYTEDQQFLGDYAPPEHVG